MPMYAAGGEMDKVTSTKKQQNDHRNRIIIRTIVVVVVLILIFGSNFSSKPLKLISQTSKYNSELTGIELSFTFRNNTIGLVFNPQYIINIKDGAGNITYTRTVTPRRLLAPTQSIEINTVVPVSPGTDTGYEIGLQCTTLKPY